MSSSIAIEISGIDHAYRSGFWLRIQPVLTAIDFSIPEGSVVGCAGENGAGKTTLIQLMTGLRRPTRGRIRIMGIEAIRPEAKRLVGFLPERPYFPEHLSGHRALEYYGALSGLDRSKRAERIPSVLAQVGLTEASRTELRRYSKGMLQRLGIAQAILHEPPILILDEPMSGLDPAGRAEMTRLIRSLARDEGKTVFFTSHQLGDIGKLCDQWIILKKGRLERPTVSADEFIRSGEHGLSI